MEEQKEKKKLIAINKKLIQKKYISIFLALFTLGVNIFAWFAFSANAGLQLEATVAAWDIEFKDNGEAVNNLIVQVTKMKPGMDDFVKTIVVNNNSDVDADFDYEIESATLLGKTIPITSQTQIFNQLNNRYPFSVFFVTTGTVISHNNVITFDVNATWDYESPTPIYYQLDNIYDYDASLTYYKKVNNNYVEYTPTSETDFIDQRSNLYLEKDDADSYFGERCYQYEAANSKACLVLTVKLVAIQSLDEPSGP